MFQLLSAKFYFPPHRPELIQRLHLFDRLDAGLGGKVTLVSAPAGFGKTTLVSEWIQHCCHHAAWLSLDKNDNDLSRFLIYLTAALQHVDPEIGLEVRAALEDSPSPNYEILLTRLIAEIERLPDKSVLVLDDYHLIEARPVHDAIHFLIEYLPATTHLVICGRADPPLPVSRLRVRGELNEVRTPQLRFTKTEVAAYLNQRMGFDLSSERLAALEERTEGWIASLKLAALSMQGRDDWPEFIAKFSGSNRYVIDYLVDEVMARQPEEVQTFLRRTSILERFCAPLCEVVVGENQEKDIVAYLDRSNLFLVPLDDRREWYRYHHLFADFLHQRLNLSEPDRIPELHRRASQWYQDQGAFDEAIQHALAAGDLEGATRLVSRIAADLVVRREANKLIKWVRQLPSGLVQGYPRLCTWYAWALLFMGQLEMVEPVLTLVENHQGQTPGLPNPGYLTTVRAYLANYRGDLLASIALCEQALEEMSPAAPDRTTLIFRGSAVICLGLNQRELGHLDKARQLFTEAARLNQEAGNYYAALASFEQLAKLAVICGQLDQAQDFYRRGLNLAGNWMETGDVPQGSLIAAAGLQLGLGTVLYQLDDLTEAEEYIRCSADLLELGELWARTQAYTLLGYLSQVNGEFDVSAEYFRKACAVEESGNIRQANNSDLPSLARLGLLLSRARPEHAHLLSEVCRRVEKLGVQADDEVDFSSPAGYPCELIYSDLACSLIALNRADEALPLLTRLLEAAVQMERYGDAIRYRVSTALAHYALGDLPNALDSLGRALTLAEPQGYVRQFVDEGQPAAELLRFAISKNISPGYAGRLLTAFPEAVLSAISTDPEQTAEHQILVEPLTGREIEVLRLMAEGCKYQEIAARLVVSINTVRHHTRNLYGKLDANNRTQALGRAKELKLL